jgi:glutamate-1-semialdehyde 2,1-aminomutase
LPAVPLFMAAVLLIGTAVFCCIPEPAVFGCRFKWLRDTVHTLLSVEARMYPDPNSSSQKMYDRALASLPGGNTRTTVFMKPYPIYAARGEGCRVWDLDGNAYIDCINNFTSQIHGHAHPALIKAATAQLALGSAFGLPTQSEVELAELLAARLPSVDQVRFCNSGTEAA